jgi:hypothetical protein
VGTFFDVTTTVVDTCTMMKYTVDNTKNHVQEETIEIQVSDDDLGVIATVELTVEVTQQKSATKPYDTIIATVSAVKIMTVVKNTYQKE